MSTKPYANKHVWRQRISLSKRNYMGFPVMNLIPAWIVLETQCLHALDIHIPANMTNIRILFSDYCLLFLTLIAGIALHIWLIHFLWAAAVGNLWPVCHTCENKPAFHGFPTVYYQNTKVTPKARSSRRRRHLCFAETPLGCSRSYAGSTQLSVYGVGSSRGVCQVEKLLWLQNDAYMHKQKDRILKKAWL